MTLASDISTTSTSLSDIKNAIIAKGVTPSGNITTYAAAIGNINTDGIGPKREIINGVYQMPTENFTFSLPSGVTDVGDYALYSAFYGCTRLTSVDLSSLTTVGTSGLQYAFYGCTSLTSVDLSSLTTVGTNGLYSAFNGCTGLTGALDLSSLTTVSSRSGLAHSFHGCTGLTSVNLSSLTTVYDSGLSYSFYGCTRLTSVNLSSLTTVGASGLQYAFQDCTSLTSVNLSSLTTLSTSACVSRAFQGCTGLTSLSFPALTTTSFGSSYTNQFGNMMQGTGSTVTHTIHFPSNMESTISGLSGYPLFGGTSGYVVLAYDLPATS